MDNVNEKVIHPVGIFREAVALWLKNLLPLVAISCVNVLLLKSLEMLRPGAPSSCPAPAGSEARVAVLYLAGMVLFVIASTFLMLMMTRYLRATKEETITIAGSIQDTASRFGRFIGTYSLLFLFAFGLVVVGGIAFGFGQAFVGKGPLQGAKLVVLLTTSTVLVVSMITAFWYGFFFSIGPLIAAFEQSPAIASLKESRLRIKGSALRYLGTILLNTAFYLCVGLAAYFILTRFTREKAVLNMLDPVISAVFGPLGLAVWFLSYKKLTDLKK